ncbi:phytanoyl-CoA dioxygenase [Paenibacillus psychroresistens]|uniref:Phytanoyl-CoA dioxygenase n=1 Tax=Paenibacillus psychroresistens TaxID=1778678 RepID=A0A6B8RH02_9BACL|nr:phytanoyl-CoA dioxygenase family protein [Paenibacillus psychroresistens]QGQ94822.1 phytanoyl-CoA dioxygenase [Paenibacillus psychroresistens]
MGHVDLKDNDKKPITQELEDSTSLLNDHSALRAKAKKDGFLFFRGLLQRESVMQLRHDILSIVNSHRLLDPARPLIEGIANLKAINRYAAKTLAWNGVGVPMAIYKAIQKLESFHALAHDSKLLALYEIMFEKPVFVHPRNIGRVMLPHHSAKITPSHQDFLHIQGAENTWTCWTPLGDVPRELGGLALLKGSNNAGLLGVVNAPGAGGLESILCGLDYEWQTSDFQAGDLVTFHSHTVHKSTPNQIPNQIRMSCDFRYQPIDDVIEPASLLPHGPYTWKKLYEGWSRDDLKYYWKDIDFRRTAFDESIRWQKDKIC